MREGHQHEKPPHAVCDGEARVGDEPRGAFVNALAEATRLALTAAIKASAEARACTERLAGKSIAFEFLGQRLVVHFEAGAVRVDSAEDAASATVRGSPAAVCGALLGGDGRTAAVFGEAAVVEDFRASFRPHLELPHAPRHLGEDLSDAAHLAFRAARSALEGAVAALREESANAPDAQESAAEDPELQRLRARVADLEARLAAVEGGSPSTEDSAS